MTKKKNSIIFSAVASIIGFFAAVICVSTPLPAYAADVKCSVLPQSICDRAKDDTAQVKDSGVMELLKWVLRIMTAGVGIVATGALVYAGILYASASDNASQISQAKTIITNVVIGIVAYGLMILVVNFLIPGGVFG